VGIDNWEKTKVSETAIEYANLGKQVGHRVNILINVNTKIVCKWILIFKHKIGAKADNECINHSIIDGKDATVHVQCNDAIIANEQTRVIC